MFTHPVPTETVVLSPFCVHVLSWEKKERKREYKRATRSYVRQTERTCAVREETMRWWSSRLEIMFARGQREIPKPWYVCHLQRHSLLSNPSIQSETEMKEERRESDSPDGLFFFFFSSSRECKETLWSKRISLAIWLTLAHRCRAKRIRLHHVEGKRRTPVILFGIYHHSLVGRRSFLTVNAFSLRVCRESEIDVLIWLAYRRVAETTASTSHACHWQALDARTETSKKKT